MSASLTPWKPRLENPEHSIKPQEFMPRLSGGAYRIPIYTSPRLRKPQSPRFLTLELGTPPSEKSSISILPPEILASDPKNRSELIGGLFKKSVEKTKDSFAPASAIFTLLPEASVQSAHEYLKTNFRETKLERVANALQINDSVTLSPRLIEQLSRENIKLRFLELEAYFKSRFPDVEFDSPALSTIFSTLQENLDSSLKKMLWATQVQERILTENLSSDPAMMVNMIVSSYVIEKFKGIIFDVNFTLVFEKLNAFESFQATISDSFLNDLAANNVTLYQFHKAFREIEIVRETLEAAIQIAKSFNYSLRSFTDAYLLLRAGVGSEEIMENYQKKSIALFASTWADKDDVQTNCPVLRFKDWASARLALAEWNAQTREDAPDLDTFTKDLQARLLLSSPAGCSIDQWGRATYEFSSTFKERNFTIKVIVEPSQKDPGLNEAYIDSIAFEKLIEAPSVPSLVLSNPETVAMQPTYLRQNGALAITFPLWRAVEGSYSLYRKFSRVKIEISGASSDLIFLRNQGFISIPKDYRTALANAEKQMVKFEVKMKGSSEEVASGLSKQDSLSTFTPLNQLIEVNSCLFLSMPLIETMMKTPAGLAWNRFKEFAARNLLGIDNAEWLQANIQQIFLENKATTDWDMLVWATKVQGQIAKGLLFPGGFVDITLSQFVIESLKEKYQLTFYGDFQTSAHSIRQVLGNPVEENRFDGLLKTASLEESRGLSEIASSIDSDPRVTQRAIRMAIANEPKTLSQFLQSVQKEIDRLTLGKEADETRQFIRVSGEEELKRVIVPFESNRAREYAQLKYYDSLPAIAKTGDITSFCHFIVQNGNGEKNVNQYGESLLVYRLKIKEVLFTLSLIVSPKATASEVAIRSLEARLQAKPSVQLPKESVRDLLVPLQILQTGSQEDRIEAGNQLLAVFRQDPKLLSHFIRRLGITLDAETRSKLLAGTADGPRLIAEWIAKSPVPIDYDSIRIKILTRLLNHTADPDAKTQLLKFTSSAIKLPHPDLNEVPLILLRNLTKVNVRELLKIEKLFSGVLEKLKSPLLSKIQKERLIEVCLNLITQGMHLFSHNASLGISDLRKGSFAPMHVSFFDLLNGNKHEYERFSQSVAADKFSRIVESCCGSENVKLVMVRSKSGYDLVQGAMRKWDLPYDMAANMSAFVLKPLNTSEQLAQSGPSMQSLDATLPSGKLHYSTLLVLGQEFIVFVNKMEDASARLRFDDWFAQFRVSKSILGFNQDQMTIKRRLAESGWFSTLLDSLPLTASEKSSFSNPPVISSALPTSARLEIQQLKEEIHLSLRALQHASESSIVRFRMKLFEKYNNFLSHDAYFAQEEGLSALFYEDYKGTMQRIVNLARKIASVEAGSETRRLKIQAARAHIQELYEQFAKLLVYNPVKIPQDLMQQYDKDAVLTVPGGRNYLFSSGMSCNPAIIESLSKLKLSLNYTNLLNVFYVPNHYFEITSDGPSIEKMYAATMKKTSSFNEADVVFTYVYPNNADAKTRLEKMDNIGKVREYFDNLAAPRAFPLTLVIDTATTVFFHPEVQEIVRQLQSYIDKKQLVIILTNSLEKYPTLSFDKYRGGINQIYAHEAYESLNREMLTQQYHDQVSVPALQSFALLQQLFKMDIIEYVDTIKANTNYVYKQLSAMMRNLKLFRLTDQGENLPHIGIQFERLRDLAGSHFLSSKIRPFFHSYLHGKLAALDFFSLNRNSFGFDHESIQDTSSECRLGIGAEKTLLNDYCFAVYSILEEMETYFSIPSHQQAAFINILSNFRQLTEWNLKLKILPVTGSFMEYIEMLADKARQHDLLNNH